METTKLMDGYRQWFSQYRWSWFGTLTFRGYPAIRKTYRYFDCWINELDQKYGRRDFRWVRVTEYGAYGINTHFHLLVGGLRAVAGARYLAINHWQQLAGEANTSSFIAHKGGIGYILKTLQPHRDFEIDFHLPPTPKVGL